MEEKKNVREQQGKPKPLTYSEGCNVYLTDCSLRQQKSTVTEKETYFREFAQFMRRDFIMADITVATCREFLTSVVKIRHNKAANRRLRALKALWNWQREFVPDNPWRLLRPFPEEEYIKYVPPQADVVAVLDKAGDWQKRLLLFVVNTGARIGEILNLKWADVADDRIRLWTRKRKNGAAQARAVGISQSLRMALDEQRELTYGRDYVFINPETFMPFRTRQPSIKFMMKRLCAAAGVKPFGFHALRHFVASQLLRSGEADLSEIQGLLGHTKATTTALYLKSIEPKLDHMVSLMDRVILPAANN